MPSIQQLRYLVAVADTLSFSVAAGICHVTQPTLSMQLKDLERRLGVVLVERSRARVIMTPEGESIAKRARSVLSEVEDIRAIARAGSNATGGTLRVGVVHTLGAYLLPLLVPGLRQQFPDLRLYVREELPATLIHHLDSGRHDFLLYPLPIPRADFVSLPLFHEPLQVVMAHDHPLSAKRLITPADLRGVEVLTIERGHNLFEQISRLCAEAGASLSYDYEGTSLDTLRQMVAMGMGVALLPSLYVRSEVQREELVTARPFADTRLERVIGMAWRQNSPRERSFHVLGRAIRDILAASQPPLDIRLA